MEQYYMPKELDFENLRYCIDNYQPTNLFIRLKGSSGGTRKVQENLINKTLDFQKTKFGLDMIIDSKIAHSFPLDNYEKGFTVQYRREDEKGHMHFKYDTLDEPNRTDFPTIKESVFRTALDDHLMEIDFKGKIELEEHSWWNKPHLHYWTIKKKS